MRRLNPEAAMTAPRLARLADALAAPVPALAAAAETAPDPAAQLRLERDQVFEAARAEGKAQGLAEAEAEVAKRVDAISRRLEIEHRKAMQALETRIAEISRLGEGMAAAIAEHAAASEETAVESAYAALLRVLGERSADRTLMRELCQQALLSRGAGSATLRLAPEDREDLALEGTDLQIIADAALTPGQCILESNRGASDTGLDVRLEAMKRAFLAGLSGHRQAG